MHPVLILFHLIYICFLPCICLCVVVGPGFEEQCQPSSVSACPACQKKKIGLPLPGVEGFDTIAQQSAITAVSIEACVVLFIKNVFKKIYLHIK